MPFRKPPPIFVPHVLAQHPPLHSAFELPVLLILMYISSSQPNSKMKVKSFSGEMMCLPFFTDDALIDGRKQSGSRPVVLALSIWRVLSSDAITQKVPLANQIDTFLIRPLHFSNVSVGRWHCLHVVSHIDWHAPLLYYSDMRPRIRPA